MTVRRSLSRVFFALSAHVLSALAGAQALRTPSSLPSTPPSGATRTFGTAQTSYVDVGEWEFSPIDSATTYSDVGIGAGNLLRFSTTPSGAFLAPVHLPSGAVLQSVELDACDSNALDKHVQAVIVHCDHVTGLCAIVGNVMESTSAALNSCKSYVQDLSAVNYAVDNTGDRLVLQAFTVAGDDTTSLAGMKVGYKLQVSPAPAVADFGDVPGSHPFFQYIEALYHSGVTGGCGGGNFCPDAALTRGQMAVFLAKALGLQFP
jgi:hypothetical protein